MLSKALFTWIAFPVYVWQGIAVRLKIERLHPAIVPHEGRFPGKGEEIRLLVAGDSSVAAVGMTRLEDTLAWNLARTIAGRTGRPVYWRAAGANSATAADLRDHVLPHVERRDFTHLVLAVGTNDMKNFHAVRRFKKDFGTLLYTARTRFPHARIVWAPVADMTKIPALPRALGRTRRRSGTPVAAVALSMTFVTAVPIVSVLLGAALWTTMQWLLLGAATGYLVAYFLACVAAPVFLWRIGESGWRSTVVAAAGAVGVAVILVAYLVVESTGARAGAVWVMVGVLGATVVLAAGRALFARRNPRIRGVYDVPTIADVWGGRRGEP